MPIRSAGSTRADTARELARSRGLPRSPRSYERECTLVSLPIGSGFTVTHLDEWGPALEQVDALPRSTKNATGR
ncbi:hypothetical protein WS61_18175 [Burkholderia sp. ABCPW 11]|nr:hypothetical protein WS61_18175 [Burkholderia sp. ABCPW 11]